MIESISCASCLMLARLPLALESPSFTTALPLGQSPPVAPAAMSEGSRQGSLRGLVPPATSERQAQHSIA